MTTTGYRITIRMYFYTRWGSSVKNGPNLQSIFLKNIHQIQIQDIFENGKHDIVSGNSQGF